MVQVTRAGRVSEVQLIKQRVAPHRPDHRLISSGPAVVADLPDDARTAGRLTHGGDVRLNRPLMRAAARRLRQAGSTRPRPSLVARLYVLGERRAELPGVRAAQVDLLSPAVQAERHRSSAFPPSMSSRSSTTVLRAISNPSNVFSGRRPLPQPVRPEPGRASRVARRSTGVVMATSFHASVRQV